MPAVPKVIVDADGDEINAPRTDVLVAAITYVEANIRDVPAANDLRKHVKRLLRSAVAGDLANRPDAPASSNPITAGMWVVERDAGDDTPDRAAMFVVKVFDEQMVAAVDRGGDWDLVTRNTRGYVEADETQLDPAFVASLPAELTV